jgi:hypothetical protein
MILETPVHGEQHGCHDQAQPTDNSEYQLSRIYDMLFAAQEAGLLKDQIQKIFSSLPETMKLEFNYSNWRYCNIGAKLTYRSPTRLTVSLAGCINLK